MTTIAAGIVILTLGAAFLFAAFAGGKPVDLIARPFGVHFKHMGRPARIISGVIGILLLILGVYSLLARSG